MTVCAVAEVVDPGETITVQYSTSDGAAMGMYLCKQSSCNMVHYVYMNKVKADLCVRMTATAIKCMIKVI